MSKITTDIDLDFADRTHALAGLPHVPAMLPGNRPHASGVYFQDIPVNPLTGMASIDHDEAAAHGYFKLDFLNNYIYEGVRDEDHLVDLINREPPWDFFMEAGIVEQLSHLGSHYGVVQQIKPKSIEDLAVVLALIRPAKKHLLFRSRAEIDAAIWAKPQDGYHFKRPHAIAYAASIVVQLNLMVEKIAEQLD
jgi:hypothetical protein